MTVLTRTRLCLPVRTSAGMTVPVRISASASAHVYARARALARVCTRFCLNPFVLAFIRECVLVCSRLWLRVLMLLHVRVLMLRVRVRRACANFIKVDESVRACMCVCACVPARKRASVHTPVCILA
eukprot:724291-Pleurochrysis_carterae.AAC.3